MVVATSPQIQHPLCNPPRCKSDNQAFHAVSPTSSTFAALRLATTKALDSWRQGVLPLLFLPLTSRRRPWRDPGDSDHSDLHMPDRGFLTLEDPSVCFHRTVCDTRHSTKSHHAQQLAGTVLRIGHLAYVVHGHCHGTLPSGTRRMAASRWYLQWFEWILWHPY
ncbi:hypothetical protein BCR34DRAFT_188807 [Clohesyomyces aquaticus]|uniref:Uncharacterized protein n=1 Tax=Clohesyomyces aquaticus TaxID=1231657 RepID=A0A1Y1ZY21_9PLEO|nr:hypothetical protein BCR34DRAFT_188807 [Clohesyomyces aquaticus]